MRSRFEEYKEDDHLDEPVTITGRQLKSLKRAATTGLIATILAIIAVGLGAWNLVQAGKSAPSEPMGAEPAAQAQPAPAAAATDSVPSPTPTPQPLQTGAAATPPAASPTPAVTAKTAVKPASKRHASAAPVERHSRSASSGEEPVTTPAFSPSAAPVPSAIPSPAPSPVAPKASTAAPDTSKH